MTEFGAFFTAADVARALGWPTRRARRWLQSTRAGVKRGGRWVTSRGLLLTYFPELLDALDTQAGTADIDRE
jgi:hypothetical protein